MSNQNTTTVSQLNKKDILQDYQIVAESRETALVGRKEVFMGKAKFGIFGDGKEVPQVAMARAFQKGDWRSGYYRDQTFMMAIGEMSIQAFFAQLYAHTDLEAEPASGGRMMNGHFGTRWIDNNGDWKSQADTYNVASDISPTAGQMPRIMGLSYASKLYRKETKLQGEAFSKFSNNGNEVVFSTIGNASTSEGMFLETINAVGVMQLPVVMSVWDDQYGISVGPEHHTVKQSISKALEGFQRTEEHPGIEIFEVNGWDYPALVETYQAAAKLAREEHVPCLVHVVEITQPQGHSTSGSHERYKSKERLSWEEEFDCVKKMREWILAEGHATEEELEAMELAAKKKVKEEKNAAFKAFLDSMVDDRNKIISLIENLAANENESESIKAVADGLKNAFNPIKLDTIKAAKKALRIVRSKPSPARMAIQKWLQEAEEKHRQEYNTLLYCEDSSSALKVPVIAPTYGEDAEMKDGREIINGFFFKAMEKDPRVFAFGEDVGKIGDVNQGMAGLQDKFGALRVHDTSIREMTIIGEGTGAAMRGLRPIAEIQYLDYLVYALNTLTDDVACLHHRTAGGQKAPLIVRTRGHRLEGVWHSGSPISMILGSLRGMYVLTPRNFVQAAGMYNTLLQADDPALVIECLNGYRLKEKMPSNLGEYTVPLGQPEILRSGTDVTVVTYGSMCRIIAAAAEDLAQVGISVEIIDAQTLVPFDLEHKIVESIKKTNRVVFADEDVQGGASAYLMQKVLDEQKAYQYLDSQPICIASQDHRPAYGSDGDYFSKPNPETIFDAIYKMMHEYDPQQFPEIY